MNVTREIVKDLLPMYVAGEVSADSRTAVEAALSEDADLARLAAAMRDDVPAMRPPAAAPAGRIALDRTKALVRRRTWTLALAWFFTGLPLTFVFDAGGFRFLLLRDAPFMGGACLAVALVLWSLFAGISRRLRVTGL